MKLFLSIIFVFLFLYIIYKFDTIISYVDSTNQKQNLLISDELQTMKYNMSDMQDLIDEQYEEIEKLRYKIILQ